MKLPRLEKSWLQSWNKPCYLLAGFIAFLFLLSLIRPLSHPDEGRYAEIGRWMLQSGDWMTPRLNGMPFFHKPPLLYWMEALFYAVFGVHSWVARLTPVLHASLMLLTVYALARRFGSAVLANRAVVMVGSSLAFLAGGQYVNHDLMVATWISIAIGSFAMAFMAGDKPERRWAWLGFLACGLGILSKGLIGLALPGMVLLIWLVWTRQLKKVIYLPWFSGLALLGLIALPWFLLAQQRFPGMLNYMFGMHHFQRFTGTAFNNNQPWWFYLVGLVLLFFPWVFFSFANLFKPSGPQPIGAQTGQAANPSFQAPIMSLCWIWVMSIIGFFSFPAAKVIGYALPVIPPLAILAAVGWQRAMGQMKHERRYFAGLCAINLVIALGLTVAMGIDSKKKSALEVGETYACLAKSNANLYVLDGFPYDLPFALNASKPMVVVQDWDALRHIKSDNWHSELIDAAMFAPNSSQLLQDQAQLDLASAQADNWLLANVASSPTAIAAWVKVRESKQWRLYRSKSTTTAGLQNELRSPSAANCLHP